MSIYEDIVDAIVARLSGTEDEPTNIIANGMKVQRLPEFRGNHKPVDPVDVTRLTVGIYQHLFGTERAPTAISLDQTAQTSDLYVAVAFAGRALYGTNGVYYAIDQAFRLLVGWDMNGITPPLQAYSSDLLTLDSNNAWVYQLVFRFPNFIVMGVTDSMIGTDPSEWPYGAILKEVEVEAEKCPGPTYTMSVGGEELAIQNGDQTEIYTQ